MKKKVLVFDLDGTLTEHRTWISDENTEMLDALKNRGYRILVCGAGAARRVFAQMRKYPVDIIAKYGLQYAKYRDDIGGIELIRDLVLSCDKVSVEERILMFREKFGFSEFVGDSVEFHETGSVTVPLLGTKADIHDKLVFDPDRSKRREIYGELANLFPEYSVFIAGSSSFDMVPMPYNKYYALDVFCKEEGYSHEELVYFGDEYGTGGNDEVVFSSDIDFVRVDRSSDLPSLVEGYLC